MTSMRTPQIRVLLVEDHAIVREGLRRLLDEAAGITVVAEAWDCRSAKAALASHDVDVLMLDLSLPDGTGHDVIASLSGSSSELSSRSSPKPNPHVLVLTMHDDAETLSRCLSAGVLGFQLKGSSATQVLAAVRAVAAGRQAIDPAVAGLSALGRHVEPLTPRERSVLALVAEGLTSAEVAAELGLTVKTVRNYRQRILAKLGVSTTAAMVRTAMRYGWIR